MTQHSISEVWSVDTEWGFRDGHIDWESAWEPVVCCLVGMKSGQRHFFWGGEGRERLRTFITRHGSDAFVAHNVVAEMKYLLRLRIPPPRRWFDTYVAERWLTNSPGHLEAGLSAALRRRGLPHLAPDVKDQLRQRILNLEFDPDDPGDRQEIVDYCFSDCDGCLGLYNLQEPDIGNDLMNYWIEYLKAVSRMELRGIPIDMEAWDRIRNSWPDIRQRVVAAVNRTHPVYDGDRFQGDQLVQFCAAKGIAWPTKLSEATGKRYHCMDNDTMKLMEGRDPFIAEVRQVRKTLAKFAHRGIVVDETTQRHNYSTWPFRSITGRNQPRDFIFSGPKWLRFLMVPPTSDHVLVYVDFVAQEVGLAAGLSGDAKMREIYEAKDCHMAFAIRAGAAPEGAIKKTHPGIRKVYKATNLGVQYGQTEYGIANRLGISRGRAAAIINDHRRLFPDFWAWQDRIVQGSFDRGWIVTPCGWRCTVPPAGNERTWFNWPMQSAGSDCMRLSVIYLDQQGVQLLAPVHDGFLMTCRREQLGDLRTAVNHALAMAAEHVVPGFPLRWDIDPPHEVRYVDDDGAPFWAMLSGILEKL